MDTYRRFWFGLTIISVFVLHCCDAWWIQFYKETDFNELKAEVNDTETNAGYCLKFRDNNREVQHNFKSLKTTRCVRVFFKDDCAGSWSQYPGPSNVSNLGINNDKIFSFRICTPEEEKIQMKSLDVTLYESDNFQGSFIQDKWINGSCITLNPQSQNRTRSIVTSRCVHLFDEEDCNGNTYAVGSRTKPNLNSFNDKTVSFRGCSSPTTANDEALFKSVEVLYNVAFFNSESFKKLIFQGDLVYDRCYQNPKYGGNSVSRFSIKFPALSVISSASCLTFFENSKCDGEAAYALRYGSYPSLDWVEIDFVAVGSFKIDDECSTKANGVLPTPSERGFYHQAQANSASEISGSMMSSWLLLTLIITITLFYM